MEFFDKKRISVIVEKACHDEVIKLIENSGATGFTVYKEIYGKGAHGVRGDYGSIDDISSNLEIVSVTGPEVAVRILQGLESMINRGFVMIVYVTDVKVIRDDHFD